MRTGLFVDTNNLYLNISKRYGKKLDYKRLLEKIGETNIKFAFGIRAGDEAKGFISSLKMLGFETKFVLKSSCTNLNTDICVEVIKRSGKLDHVILCTSDKDIQPLVNYLKDLGIVVTLIGCNVVGELSQIAKTVEITVDELEGGISKVVV